MPTRKEWVVDEKGFHAKSVWESMPSDKTVVNIDDTEDSSGKNKNEDKYEVKLLKGTWLEGAEGFQFNKKCKVRVEGKFLKDTNRTRVSINTYSSFRDEKKNEDVKEPLGQTIEANLEKVNKDSMEAFAEAEVMLYYGDKYSKALREKPDLTCRYTFTAQSNVAKKVMEKSEELEMPRKKNELYGGFELKKGDNDNKKIWGGEKRDVEGSFVAELQEDLFSLGYWITDGLKVYDPIVYDGDFGNGTYSGLKTFQYEHKGSYKLEVTGKLYKKSAEAIKECKSNSSFKRPGIKIDQNDIDGDYCKYAKEKPAKPERYYQLPPSVDGGYKRYGECKCSTGGELGDVYHNDIWGAKDTIDAIITLAQKWKSENDILEIGDISRWDVKKFSAHSSHLAGYSVDIRSDKVGAMQKGGSDNKSFDKDKSVTFAKMAIALGFKYIITKCPHVAAECNKKAKDEDLKMYVNLYDHHHHHFHMDFWQSGTKSEFPDDRYSERAYCKECVHKDSCDSDKNITKEKDKKEDKEKDNDKIEK